MSFNSDEEGNDPASGSPDTDLLIKALSRAETVKLSFQNFEDLEAINAFLSFYFQGKKNVITGINALMVNAIEHGNLGIGFEEKGQLLQKNLWREEIEKRLSETENAEKKAELVLTRKDDGIYAIVQDMGNGFEWKKFLTVNPSRASHKHGRGIALAASLSFDQLTYNEKGNQAVGFIQNNKAFNW